MADPVTLTVGQLVTTAMWNDIVNLLLALRSGTAAGAVFYNIIFRTIAYTAVAGDVVLCSGTFTVTLPAAAGKNKPIVVINNGSGTITVGRTGTDTVGLATSQALYAGTSGQQGDALSFVSDGVSNWGMY
jgi:hypothetical protein